MEEKKSKFSAKIVRCKMKKKNVISQNYLEKKPIRTECIGWSKDEEDVFTLAIVNKGVFTFIAQKLFNRPRISYVHLDEMGSFIWPHIDGEKDILAIGKLVEEQLIIIDDDNIKLTNKGIDLANLVWEEFV